ncbi:MAG: site-specific integrase [Rhodoferax sp.]|nr:site-specific integrase [Rhodoferax sp.]
MTSDILKLIGPATALATGTHLRISEAVASSGIALNQLLQKAAEGKLRLYCRLSHSRGHALSPDGLEFENPSLGARGGRVMPSPRQMPDGATEVVLSGLLPIPFDDGRAIASAILADGLKTIEVVAFQDTSDLNKLLVPDLPVHIKVDEIEVQSTAVAAIHRHLAATITSEQIEREQERRRDRALSVAVSAGKQAHKRFSEALGAYATTPSGIPGSVVSLTEQKQKIRGCSLFIELVGDLPLSEITADRLREFREKLKTLPTKANNIPKLHRRDTMAATVQALHECGVNWPTMTETAQHERMLWVDQMFRWLVAQEWLKENPLASVMGEQTKTAADRKTERQVKAQRKVAGVDDDSDDREPFTPEELRLIFGQTHYKTGNGAHAKGNEKWYPFQYWLPVISLLAGCRIKEVSQLHLSDIRESEDGTWHFDINETTADKSLKNESATRQIPVSQSLIDLGLIKYRDKLKSEGFRRLFPELSWSTSDARYAKEPVRKLSRTFEKLGMLRDGTKVFHSLRSNFNNAMLRVPFTSLPFDDPDLKRFIRLKVIGHKVEGVNENHYSGATMIEKLALMDGVRYDLAEIAKFDIDFGVAQVRAAIGNKNGFRRGHEDMGPLNSD